VNRRAERAPAWKKETTRNKPATCTAREGPTDAEERQAKSNAKYCGFRLLRANRERAPKSAASTKSSTLAAAPARASWARCAQRQASPKAR